MPISREDLLKKGWTDEEIDYTFNVIDSAKDKKTAFIHFLDGAISWFGLFMVFLGSLILSVVIMPFFITVKAPFLYLMVFLLAFVLGVVFNLLLDQINQLGKSEKIVGEIFLPVISLIDVYVMYGISNVLIDTLKVSYEPHNKILFGFVFVVSLSSPFFITHYKMIINKYFARFFMKKPAEEVHMLNGQAQNQKKNNFQQDYYQAYLEEQKKLDAKRMLYEEKLKEKLLNRLNR